MELSLFLEKKFWCQNGTHSINNTKKEIYPHKIDKTLLNIYKYINKTCLKQNQTKLKKKNYVYTIYNTNCRKNTTFR